MSAPRDARAWRPANEGCRYPAEPLSPEEVGALLRACSARTPTAIWSRALIAVLDRVSLRISHALALYPKDVDQAASAPTVLRGRGRLLRVVGMDPAAFALVEGWLDRRGGFRVDGRRPLSSTLRGGALDASYVRRLVPRLGRRAGIEKRVHPLGLRHTHAAELAAEGVRANLIQRELGHASLATASRYLDQHCAPPGRGIGCDRRGSSRGLNADRPVVRSAG